MLAKITDCAADRRRLDSARTAVTLIELLLAMAIISILTAMLLTGVSAARKRAKNATCLNNLRGVAVGLINFAGDHDNKVPMGRYRLTDEPLASASNYLGSPKILLCPTDTKPLLPEDSPRGEAAGFSGLQVSNASYFHALPAEFSSQAVLAGDRNLTFALSSTNAPKSFSSGMLFAGGSGSYPLTPYWRFAWWREMHQRAGNLALADGSVHRTTTNQANDYLCQQPFHPEGRINLYFPNPNNFSMPGR